MTQIGITSKESEPYPVLESNSKNECFGKEWPKLVLLRRRHLQPASQGSQPNETPNTTSQPANQPAKQNQPASQPNTDLVGESNAKNLVFGGKWPKLELLSKRLNPTLS